MLRCSFCASEMRYVHGHAACVSGSCPMFGVNQSECCSGEHAVIATSTIARAPSRPGAQNKPIEKASVPNGSPKLRRRLSTMP